MLIPSRRWFAGAALLALVAIPFVGLSTPFGLAIAFVGAQLLIGRTRPWLPGWIRRVALSATALTRIARWLSRGTGWMHHLVRERLGALRGDATIDIANGIGHTIPPALVQCALHRLTSHIPARTWAEAMGAARAAQAAAARDETDD